MPIPNEELLKHNSLKDLYLAHPHGLEIVQTQAMLTTIMYKLATLPPPLSMIVHIGMATVSVEMMNLAFAGGKYPGTPLDAFTAEDLVIIRAGLKVLNATFEEKPDATK